MAEVRLEKAARICVRVADQVIVDTDRGYTVFEEGLPPRHYVPRDTVKGQLEPGKGNGQCPWKGDWHHLDLIVGGERIANAAWTYAKATPVCEPIQDFIAFYPNKVGVEV